MGQADVPHPTRFYSLGSRFIVEWNRPGATERSFRTGTELEDAVNEKPSLRPALFIFHTGRCGSTLLGRLLSTDPGNRVFHEPNALLQYLGHNRAEDPEVRRHLSVLVRAYGLEPQPAERRLIVKLNSLAVWQLPALRACFPDVPFIYLLRDPSEVVASFCRTPPLFLSDAHRDRLARLMGWNGDARARLSLPEWCSAYLNENLTAAWQYADEFRAVIAYEKRAEGYVDVLNWWERTAEEGADARVASVFDQYSKDPAARFSVERDRLKVTPEIRHIATTASGPIYELWRRKCLETTTVSGRGLRPQRRETS